MTLFARMSPALALAALVISVLTAGAVAIERLSDWGLVRGEGGGAGETSPASPFEPDAASRVLFPRHAGADDSHANEMVSLTYNWGWDVDTGWSRADFDKPSVALTLESWFSGLAELNFDMRPPRGYTNWPGGRALGLAARHDGTYATLSVGGGAYNPAGSGLTVTTGLGPEAVLSLVEGATPAEAMLRVLRHGGPTSVMIIGGETPALAFGLSGTDASTTDDGVLRVSGPLGRTPLINVVESGPDATLLAVYAEAEDEAPGFRVVANGRIEWKENTTTIPVALTAREGDVNVEGGIAADSLRIGAQGTFFRSLRLLSVEIAPASVPGHATGEQVFPAPGLPTNAIVYASGPAQPEGIALAGARPFGNEQIALAFANVAADPARPAPGKYLFLVLEPAP